MACDSGCASLQRLHLEAGYELGENLFYSSSPYPWTDVVGAWHSEVSHYLYPNGSTNGGTIGHYTQVVWNSSYRVGCGMTLCPNNIYFYGCHYYRAQPLSLYKQLHQLSNLESQGGMRQ
ncbi:hypothetical protein F2P81_016338 [Scophthalmus maximus]|uniref:SCP domain-containing protein n=1 Tax=Scophthalmus maximus TaxID=52904 RepID=A0A6A4SC89_SCOMX|nr:hypothetical protein F2P81_016338 [Scophthalmus maximus]